jgi:hypothetical protein
MHALDAVQTGRRQRRRGFIARQYASRLFVWLVSRPPVFFWGGGGLFFLLFAACLFQFIFIWEHLSAILGLRMLHEIACAKHIRHMRAFSSTCTAQVEQQQRLLVPDAKAYKAYESARVRAVHVLLNLCCARAAQRSHMPYMLLHQAQAFSAAQILLCTCCSTFYSACARAPVPEWARALSLASIALSLASNGSLSASNGMCTCSSTFCRTTSEGPRRIASLCDD